MHMYIFEEFFSQTAISANLKTEFVMPMPSSRSCFGKVLFINTHIYRHIAICEKLFSKTQSMNLASVSETYRWECAYQCFGKELFIYTYVKSYFPKHNHYLIALIRL